MESKSIRSRTHEHISILSSLFHDISVQDCNTILHIHFAKYFVDTFNAKDAKDACTTFSIAARI